MDGYKMLPENSLLKKSLQYRYQLNGNKVGKYQQKKPISDIPVLDLQGFHSTTMISRWPEQIRVMAPNNQEQVIPH